MQKCSFASEAPQKRSASLKTHYEVLGVPASASQAEIKNAFISKSKECHPDVNPEKLELHDLFVQVNEAYITLGSPASRVQYDQSLQVPQTTWSNTANQSPVSPFGGVPRNRENRTHFEQYRNQYSQQRDYGFRVNHSHTRRRHYNKRVMFGVVLFMMTGGAVSYLVIRYSHESYLEAVKKHNSVASQALTEARERAIANGTRKQLEILISKHASFAEDSNVRRP